MSFTKMIHFPGLGRPHKRHLSGSTVAQLKAKYPNLLSGDEIVLLDDEVLKDSDKFGDKGEVITFRQPDPIETD